MKIIVALMLLLCEFSQLLVATDVLPPQKQPTLSFEVWQQDYMFSTTLNITSEHAYLGSIVKSPFRIRTSYELFGPKGDYEGVGICRFITLGGGVWQAQIDLYDTKKIKIGAIEGEAAPHTTTQFFLYNEERECVGIARLDFSNSKFIIVHPSTEQPLVSFKRNYVRGIVDYWNVTIHVLDAIDLKLIKIFAAFAVDSQDEFQND
jgi:hypothetical protein